MKEGNAGWRYLVRTNHAPEYPPEPPDSVECTLFDRCKDCPYPAHGVICWHDEKHCMRTMVGKIQERKEAK